MIAVNTIKIDNVTRNNNKITLERLDHTKCASDFLRTVKDCVRLGYKDIVVSSNATVIYPNACLPIAGIIKFYESQGVEFLYDLDKNDYLIKCGFVKQFEKDREEIQREYAPFDKIFIYKTSGQVADLTQAYIDSISHQSICEEGVLKSLIWCINEVMDNVLVHSESEYGMVMAQYHPQKKHIAFCIYDSGIGIHNSMKNSVHHPKEEIDSLSLAVQEGVGDGKGQGNGLFGLFEIVKENHGRLTLSSGGASIMLLDDGYINKYDRLPFISYRNKSTTVDFQIDLNNPVNLDKVFKSIGGFDGFDIRIDDMIDDNGYLEYDVFDNGQGTATREAGLYLRNDIENILRREKTKIILDFTKVQTVSSSFIDELLAKMVLDIGFINFNDLIQIKGMNKDVKLLCERSLYMRIFEEWKNK